MTSWWPGKRPVPSGGRAPAGRALRRRVDRTLAGFAAVIAALHVIVYWRVAGGLFDASAPPWQGFWDQEQYLRSARAFARGDLGASEHWYALGYPLLGAPFVDLLPRDPFFLVNLASLVTFAVAFLLYFRPIIGAGPSMAAFLLAHLLPLSVDAPHAMAMPIWRQYVMPWNTAPIAALTMLVVVMVRDLRAERPVWRDVALGLLAAALVAIRPGDALALLPAGSVYVAQRLVRQRATAHAAAALAAAGLVVSLYLVLSWAIYGGLSTPYHAEVRAIGASVSDLHERAYAALFDAGVTHGEPAAALGALQPWLIVALPLAVAWAAVDGRRGLLVVGTAALSLASYLSFNDFWPYAMLRFSLIHYVVWTLPVFAAAGIAGAVVLVRDGRWGALAAALSCAAALVWVQPVSTALPGATVSVTAMSDGQTRYDVTLDHAQEIDAIDFVGAVANDSREVTLRRFSIAADGEPLLLFDGYRPVQLATGLRIGFTRHVRASHLSVVLDRSVRRHPVAAPEVRPLIFELRFVR